MSVPARTGRTRFAGHRDLRPVSAAAVPDARASTDSHFVCAAFSAGWLTSKCHTTAHNPSVWGVMRSGETTGITTHVCAALRVGGANFRWAACQEEPKTIRLMLRLVRTDYVAAYDGEQPCPFLRRLVGPDLQVIAIFGQFPLRYGA